MNAELRCPPYVAPGPYQRPDGRPPTIMDLAANAQRHAQAYRLIMEQRRPMIDAMRAAGAMARAIEQLSTAIADQVAEGNGQLT